MSEIDNAQSLRDETIDLISAALQSEQTAYAVLYERYAGGLYRLCYSLLLQQQDAEDVVQEAFVYAFKNLHRFDVNRASFKTWLYTIAVSRCRNVYRRKRPPSMDIVQIQQLNIPAPHSETPEAMLAHSTAREAISLALGKLSERLREALVLRYGHGLSYREMSEVMDCPQKTAESRVRLAHKRLHSVLQPVGEGLLEELLKI
jgi:RNA polymerase sigma-70 factor (ECF subfamily)